MKNIFPLFLFFYFAKSDAQIVPLFKQLTQPEKDTSISIRYFKNADSALLDKIDSFELFLKETNYPLDSNYFFDVKFRALKNRTECAIVYRAGYHEYLMLTKNDTKQNRHIFAFFFYKGKLILCTTGKANIHPANESINLLKNLIYEHLNDSEKQKINNPPKVIELEGRPVKGYFLN